MNSKRIALALELIAALGVLVNAQAPISSPLAPPAFSSPPQAQQFRLGQLEFVGNTHTKQFVIRRMIPLTEGDIFNQSLWEFGLEQVNRSGLFEPLEQSDVVMKIDDTRGIVDIEAHVTERDRQ